MNMPNRLLKTTAVALVAAALAGCGFHLRGEIPADAKAANLYIKGLGPGKSFYQDLAQTLSFAGGQVVSTPAQAGAVIQILRANHIRRPITLSRQGLANTFDLTFRVRYNVTTPSGEILLPDQELEIRRDYFNTQISPLGQGEEEAQMRVEMEQEAAQTLLRRVVFVLNKKESGKT